MAPTTNWVSPRIAACAGLCAILCGCAADARPSSTDLRASAIDSGRWTELSPATSPPARMNAAMAWDTARHRLVLFGGASASVPFADTWEWDGSTWTEACSSPACKASSPPARTEHAMAYDEARHVTVLFGGIKPTGGGDFADTWEWDGTTWTERCTDAACAASKPVERYSHGMAYDPKRQRVVLAGGSSGKAGGILPETWEWDGGAWTQRAADGPFKISAVLAYDTKHERMLAIENDSLSSVYAWDGSAWTQLASSASPPSRTFWSAAYDGSSGRLVLFGGLSTGGSASMLGETWEWDGVGWTLAAASGPAARMSAMLASDGSRVLLFGGLADLASQTMLADTWRYVHLAANGSACTTSDDCDSANCLSGTCCEAGCNGTCSSTGTCLAGAVCDGDHTLHDATAGTPHDCAPYRCESGGVCKQTCGTIDDCVAGTLCDSNGRCVAASAASSPDEGGGCALGRGGSGRGWIAVALGLVAATPARRRRRAVA